MRELHDYSYMTESLGQLPFILRVTYRAWKPLPETDESVFILIQIRLVLLVTGRGSWAPQSRLPIIGPLGPFSLIYMGKEEQKEVTTGLRHKVFISKM